MNLSIKLKLDKIVAGMLILLMVIMVFNVSWQVVSRYIFQNPSSFTDELSRYMLIWLGMLGAAYVAGQDRHLAIDILPQKLEGRAKAWLMIVIYGMVLLFAFLVLILGGSNLVYITFILEQKSATLQLPLAYVYSIIPISGLLIAYYQIYQIEQKIPSLKAQ
jgi:TRAP-type C4-dicarboxylate transport system permease small subunit